MVEQPPELDKISRGLLKTEVTNGNYDSLTALIEDGNFKEACHAIMPLVNNIDKLKKEVSRLHKQNDEYRRIRDRAEAVVQTIQKQTADALEDKFKQVSDLTLVRTLLSVPLPNGLHRRQVDFILRVLFPKDYLKWYDIERMFKDDENNPWIRIEEVIMMIEQKTGKSVYEVLYQ